MTERVRRLRTVAKYKNMLCHRAWCVHRWSGHAFEDLYAEACCIFVDACDSYNGMSSFTTWLYRLLNTGLVRYARKNDLPLREPPDMTLEVCRHGEWNPLRQCMLRDALDKLSSEAQTVVQILLSTPCEILKLTGEESPKAIRGALRRFMQSKHKTPRRKVYASFAEIRQTLKEVDETCKRV